MTDSGDGNLENTQTGVKTPQIPPLPLPYIPGGGGAPYRGGTDFPKNNWLNGKIGRRRRTSDRHGRPFDPVPVNQLAEIPPLPPPLQDFGRDPRDSRGLWTLKKPERICITQLHVSPFLKPFVFSGFPRRGGGVVTWLVCFFFFFF